MQSIQQVHSFAGSVSFDDFQLDCPAPVLVAKQIIGGRLGKSSQRRPETPPTRRNPDKTRIARLKPSTLMHIDPSDIPDPRADDIMVTRALAREMWVPLRKEHAGNGDSRIRIGRAAQCDVVINDYTVSKCHAYFEHDPRLQHFRIIDAGSTNGTRVDEEWLEPGGSRHVHSQQFVTLGRLICQFYTPLDFYRYLRGDTSGAREFKLVVG